ncbi:MAG: hypothetical protein RBT49_00790 [Bacteroidales bacterium]|jgi:hypothetical protein|nr:hypothetical protein [Bacteroidales bacterium]
MRTIKHTVESCQKFADERFNGDVEVLEIYRKKTTDQDRTYIKFYHIPEKKEYDRDIRRFFKAERIGKKLEYTVESVQKIADEKFNKTVQVLEIINSKRGKYDRIYVKYVCKLHNNKEVLRDVTSFKRCKTACEECHKKHLSENKIKSLSLYQDRIDKKWGIGKFKILRNIENSEQLRKAEFLCFDHKRKFSYQKNNISQNFFGCEECRNEALSAASERRKSIKQMENEAKIALKEKNRDWQHPIQKRINHGKYIRHVEIVCEKHGEYYLQRIGHYTGGQVGCKECQKEHQSIINKKITFKIFEERGKKIFGEDTYLYPTGQIYTRREDWNLLFICNECGKPTWTSFQNHIYDKIGCPCKTGNKMSTGEKIVAEILTKNNIEFIFNKPVFDDLRGVGGKKLKPDFWIKKMNWIIECQSPLHRLPMIHFNDDKRFKDIVRNDKIKFDYCRNRNIIIDYFETDGKDYNYIEEKLSLFIDHYRKIKTAV